MTGVDSGDRPRVRTLGRYELFAKLGAGGMAEVHLARQRGLKRFRKLVVVKTVHPQLAEDDRFIDLLLEEARISALLKHPRVVDIYDVDEDHGVVFIAMEYLPGHSVTEIIKRGRKGRRLDVLSVARLIAGAAEGLDAAHNLRTHSGEQLELVHRDVSPGNIVVLYNGEVKLVDFGVAKARDHLSNSAIGKFAGKLGYAAPEQLGSDSADRRSDVFSLGVVLWELICLRRLFPAKSREESLRLVSSGAPKPSSLRPETPSSIDEICLRAVRPDPAERFQTAREMAQGLEAALLESGYRRENSLIAEYMEDVFTEERFEMEALVRRISESTNQISIAGLELEDATTTIDDHLPDMIPERGTASDLDTGPSIAAATSPGDVSVAGRITGVFRTDHPLRRPILYGFAAVAAILLGFVVLEIATSGATVPNEESAIAGRGVDAQAAVLEPAETVDSDPAPEPLAEPEPEPKPEPQTVRVPLPEPAPAQVPVKTTKPAKPTKLTKPAKPAKPAKEPAKVPTAESPSRDPHRSRALLREGTRAIASGDFTKARDVLKQAVAANPGSSAPHRALGVVYRRLGKRTSAIRHYRRYLRLNPKAKDATRIRKMIETLENE